MPLPARTRRLLLSVGAVMAAALSATAYSATGAGASEAATGAGRAFTARDLVNLERVSDPHLSPDGTLIAYDQRSTDFAANKSHHAIWLADETGKTPPRRLKVSEGGASHPRWSADGKNLYFLSSRSGSDQIWKTDLAGETAVQVTRLPLDVQEFRLSPDGKSLVVSLAVRPECPAIACTVAAASKPADHKATGVVYDKLFVRHWDQWADGTRNHLFLLSLDGSGIAADKARDLMPGFDGDSPGKPFGGDSDFAIAPDGQSLVFSARLAGRTEPWSTNFDLYQVSLTKAEAPKNLTPDNPAEDMQPVFSPDGTKLAWLAMKRPTFEADRLGVMVRDLKSGETHEADASFDRSVDKIVWAADGKSLYLGAGDVGRTKLFQLDLKSGATHPLTETGHVADFDVARGQLAILKDDLQHPDDIYVREPKGGWRAVTAANAQALKDVGFSDAEQFTFTGWNGETVHGFVVKPHGYEPGKRYPTAFLIHGGPQGSFGDSWSYRWNPETYAGRGYAVVMIDFHGSTGYGQAFTDAISGHWGDRPLEDLQKGWAAAQAKYSFIDGDRACALGASYGGFMVYWIAGNWSKPWKCLVDHDGVFDNRMMGYSTEELWFSEWENGHATPWASPESYERFNPITHVADWDKPMLVIHSAKDYRIPVEQGLAAFTALQRKGIESRLLTFPDENHWVLKPQNSVEWHDTVEAWLDKWIGAGGR